MLLTNPPTIPVCSVNFINSPGGQFYYSVSFMLITSITIQEHAGINREIEPVTIGIPFTTGTLTPSMKVALVDPQGKELPATLTPTGYWPDGSLRWGLLDFQISMIAHSFTELALHVIQLGNSRGQNIQISETDDELTINTGTSIFKLDKRYFNPFLSLSTAARNQAVELIDTDGLAYIAKAATFTVDLKDTSNKAEVNITGHFVSTTGSTSMGFSSCMTFYANHSMVQIDFTVSNPNAAYHPGGLWDLGDNGSIFFNRLAVNIDLEGAKNLNWQTQSGELSVPVTTEQFSIRQISSGGQNWQGNIHKNQAGKVNHQFRGYQCISSGEIIAQGNRISPILYVEHNTGVLGVHIEKFWQNFPKGLSVDSGKVSIELFPGANSGPIELQGGEQKTHRFFIELDARKKPLDWVIEPLLPRLLPDYYALTSAMCFLDTYNPETTLNKLILSGLSSDNNFFTKREIIDEYGWRNFGELYADHETLGYKGDQPLVSHYNNQYDPIYGLARQFLLTGDSRWFELMDDLAKHVADIDIYHTDHDKPEYNRGLFWHTNHYLDAETSTHRTFSQHHPDVTSDGPSGGGPASEHCYTTGFLFHYYLTGSKLSLQALNDLIQWSSNALNLPNTILGKLNFLKGTGIPAIKRLLCQETVYLYKYPLSRGTGNFINTLLDACQLTADMAYIERADKLIRQTAHPNDLISNRNLQDIENNWSYTVFLQSVAKYLDTKELLDKIDDSFIYARDTLIHYAEWIADNDQPYLSRPELLDYPNKTWVAQEIRKANILCAAYKYSGGSNKNYLNKAFYYYSYVAEQLTNHSETTFTRILVILLQNHGYYDFFAKNHDFKQYSNLEEVNFKEPPKLNYSSLTKIFIKEFWESVVGFSLKKEIQWFKHRL